MTTRIPNYPSRPHKSGQARIKVRGKDVWLGRWNSPDSRAKYARIVAELAAGGEAAPTRSFDVTIFDLVNAFRSWAATRYVKNGRQTSEFRLFGLALGPVLDLYGSTLAVDFGPLAMLTCRDELKARGYCRKKVNEHLGRIRRVFKWGVSRELVPESVWRALQAVEGLRPGEAPDMPKVKPVPPESIAAVEKHVLPPVWAMIQLQLWTAMRPGEVTIMRTCDVRASDPAIPPELEGKVWVYRPASHKTEHHDMERIVFLGPHAQQILSAWLRPENPEAYLFSPQEAVAFSRAERAARRRHVRKYSRKTRPQRAPKAYYDVTAYNHAVQRACEIAMGMPSEYRVPSKSTLSDEEKAARRAKASEWRAKHAWSPNQLRHNAATLIREKYGIEVARIICGHANIATTEIYAEADLEMAARAILQMG